MSHSLLWRPIVLPTVLIQAPTECYIPLESVQRGDLKYRFVRLFVTQTKMLAYPPLLTVE